MKTCTAPVWTASTLEEALALRAGHPEATVVAGGTDLMVVLEAETVGPTGVLNLWGCAGLRGISDDAGGLRIGALTTFTDLARDSRIPLALCECARTIGAFQIQNRATVGGNIVNASPAGDSLPMWLVLDSEFEVASLRGSRRVAASDFWITYRKVDLAPDELLEAIHVPAWGDDRLHYRKVGTRLASAISKVVLGGRLRIRSGIVREARVALGSVAPVPVRARSVEAALVGRPIDPAAADRVGEDIRPIDDVRSTAQYRSGVARNIVRRWLESEAAPG